VLAISGFEIFVAAIQAYIFAILSAVYIGGAIHQEH
jgi:F-type H+-transporting ATPase subunit a